MHAIRDLERTWAAAIGVLLAVAASACPGDDAPAETEDEGGSAGSGFSLPALDGWRGLLPTAPALPPCLPGACERHSDCDDGLYCTGRELCDPDAATADSCGCVRPNRSPCPPSYLCDEVAHACWPPPETGPCTTCSVSGDCSDGMFCNGVERCMPSAPGADRCGCVHAPAPSCALDQMCVEAEAQCVVACDFELDEDGDGTINPACGGSDCDDDDPLRYPGAVEICDADHRDEDCDARTFGERDLDGDSYPDANCCNDVGERDRSCGSDCDDTQTAIHPNEAESCDERDNDCDGAVDESVAMQLYPDGDGDGYGTGSPEPGCVGTPSTSTRAGDCDDDNPAIAPGAMRCGGAAVNDIEVCALDGTWTADSCGLNGQAMPIQCVAQPNGTGHCQQ
jgi:hypothetical protein